MTSTVADLLRRNLLDVFNERDPDRRASAIAEIYADETTTAAAAVSMSSTTAPGWETMGTWLDGASTAIAPMRAAN